MHIKKNIFKHKIVHFSILRKNCNRATKMKQKILYATYTTKNNKTL